MKVFPVRFETKRRLERWQALNPAMIPTCEPAASQNPAVLSITASSAGALSTHCMNTILTLEDVRRHAPAAFTSAPAADLTARYAHVTTAEVLERLQGDGWAITAARQGRSLSEHAVHEVRLGHPGFPANGEYRVELVIENSSDGTSALRFFAGIVRFICLNGILVGDRVADVVAVHRGKVRGHAIELAGGLRGRFAEVAGVVEQWKAVRLNRERMRVFAGEALRLRWPDREPKVDLEEVLIPRRPEDKGESLWHVYNRVQEAMTRGGFKVRFTEAGASGRLGGARRLSSIRRDVGLNRQLWNLAERFAN